MIWHITPINDLKEHEEQSTCECSPSIEIVDRGSFRFCIKRIVNKVARLRYYSYI
jgi:hypothetical protein